MVLGEADLNPDRWPMISLDVGAGRALYDRQSITTQTGGAGSRSIQTRSYTATLSTRLPLTDHLSLVFSTSGTYNRTFTPLFIESNGAAADGSLSRATPIAYSAMLRYFVF